VAACVGGDLNRMMELLAPDVTAWTDGGGKVQAALRPLHGADKVARWLLAVLSRSTGVMGVVPVEVYAQPGLLLTTDGVPDSVSVCDVADGRVTAIRLVRNPEKLRHVEVR
jgi:RNA polymerase sigma-70 factor (ECF subfamily)